MVDGSSSARDRLGWVGTTRALGTLKWEDAAHSGWPAPSPVECHVLLVEHAVAGEGTLTSPKIVVRGGTRTMTCASPGPQHPPGSGAPPTTSKRDIMAANGFSSLRKAGSVLLGEERESLVVLIGKAVTVDSTTYPAWWGAFSAAHQPAGREGERPRNVLTRAGGAADVLVVIVARWPPGDPCAGGLAALRQMLGRGHHRLPCNVSAGGGFQPFESAPARGCAMTGPCSCPRPGVPVQLARRRPVVHLIFAPRARPERPTARCLCVITSTLYH